MDIIMQRTFIFFPCGDLAEEFKKQMCIHVVYNVLDIHSNFEMIKVFLTSTVSLEGEISGGKGRGSISGNVTSGTACVDIVGGSLHVNILRTRPVLMISLCISNL